jgi:type I restriction-modification system DNA methylase subunit
LRLLLSEFLKDHRAEVENMLYTEFNLDTAQEVRAEEVREETDAKWQAVVADKDAELSEKDAELTDKNAELADKNAELADLRAKLKELQSS